ncbi:armadillo-type protein [Ephemerocybe angulata]|uniref:Nucleolar protein 9 n=1 Tax=Ephemerocybe angulata TaxID=980116 RepID=A0A8H6LTL5_9AGAR|nr:armadillo-type protein [Tulosesus angulatus]
MPKENRKRGKKHKKTVQEDEYAVTNTMVAEAMAVDEPQEVQNDSGGPSWMRSAESEFNPEAPFGYVEADVKAYFRTVDTQMRDWQENTAPVEESEDTDPNEERRMFFVAALNEIREKEKQLATDPDCSVVLERMVHSMDDFVRRVFFDSLAGSFEVLSKHRFGSHVVQTLFTIAAETVGRETRGVLPSVPEDQEAGELRTFTQLILDACEEILPVLPSLIIDPFASHVLRAVLLLLSPASSTEDDRTLRSKRSSSWKAKQGSMKSVFEEKGKGKADMQKSVPHSFTEMARRFVETLRSAVDGNEIRAMGASNVAGPCLKIFLDIEADQQMSEESDSLMDRVTAGLISSYKNGEETPESSDYVGTLLRDPTSSHLLETMVSRSPPKAFDLIWSIYFKGKLARLAAHPVANFVVAKAIERLSQDQLAATSGELDEVWHKMIQTARTGVMRAFVERAAALGVMKEEVSKTIFSAFGFDAVGDKSTLILCMLSVLTKEDFESALKSKSKRPPPTETDTRKPPHHRGPKETDPLQYKTQGSVLLQALIKMPETHNQFILDAIHELKMEDKIQVAHDASGSRIYDALLESATVPLKAKRQFIMDFIDHYHLLVDDRIGSRVGDRCWASSDTYLREKVARSLIPYESQLAGSFYGKFFVRNLNLYMLQRKPDEWRNVQSQRRQQFLQEQKEQQAGSGYTAPPKPQPQQPQQQQQRAITATHDANSKEPPVSRKRPKPSDEIEELFDKTLGKRVKKAALDVDGNAAKVVEKPVVAEVVAEVSGSGEKKKGKKGKKERAEERDRALDDVLGAIKSAPKHDSDGRPKKKHRRE